MYLGGRQKWDVDQKKTPKSRTEVEKDWFL